MGRVLGLLRLLAKLAESYYELLLLFAPIQTQQTVADSHMISRIAVTRDHRD